MPAYLKRVIDTYLEQQLSASGAVLIEGAKWCGKTRTAEEHAKSILYMQDPDYADRYKLTAETKPSMLLKGDVPRLIDEWQTSPVLWDAVRFAVDRRGIPGQFILTGSSVPADDAVMHSGTGRISRVLMRPMSLFESLESNGSLSLNDLFDSDDTDIEAFSDLTLENLASAIARGGWPNSIGADERRGLINVSNYIKNVTNTDVSQVDGIRRNPSAVQELMRSISRNISTEATMSALRKDMMGDDDSITEKTVASYMNALRRIFVVEDLPAWNPSLRSKAAVRTSPKRHFVDPSIAAGIMHLTPDTMLDDLNTFGMLFESMCVRDLRVYSQVSDCSVYHYRDSNNLEADAVVYRDDGKWGAVEVKVGSSRIDEGARNLIKLRDNIDSEKMNPPSFLAVITATEYAYRRKDGVLIIPIGCLRD